MDKRQYFLEQIINKMRVFRGFSPRDLQGLLKLCHFKNFEPKEQIYTAGDPSDEMLILVKGKLIAVSATGAVLGEILPGASTGEMGVFTGQPRSANVLSTAATVGVVIRKPELDALLDRDWAMRCKVLENIIQLLSERLIEANIQIERFAKKSQEEEKEEKNAEEVEKVPGAGAEEEKEVPVPEAKGVKQVPAPVAGEVKKVPEPGEEA